MFNVEDIVRIKYNNTNRILEVHGHHIKIIRVYGNSTVRGRFVGDSHWGRTGHETTFSNKELEKIGHDWEV